MKKAVFFDFDGTIAYSDKILWKSIWEHLGYSIEQGSYYRELFDAFISKKLTYKQWCDLSCKAYIARNLKQQDLLNLSKNIHLFSGAEETFKALKDAGFSLHILSGNVVNVIKMVLGENVKYFDSINANNFMFDDNDNLLKIQPTLYDFEGKAKFIEEYIQKNNVDPKDLFFVGNGSNDLWAYQTGINTICVNSTDFNEEDKAKWHNTILGLDNLTMLLPYIIKD